MSAEPLTWTDLGTKAHEVDPYGWKTEAIAFALRHTNSTITAHRFLAYVITRNWLGEQGKYDRAMRELTNIRTRN